MASISTQIELIDKMSAPLANITKAVEQAISSLQRVDAATAQGFDATPIDAAWQAVDATNAELQQTSTVLQTVDAAIDRGFDDAPIDSARQAVDAVNGELNQTQTELQQNTLEQLQFNDAATQGVGIMQSLTKWAGAAGLGYAIKQAASLMYTSATTLEATEAKFQTVFAGYEDVAQGIVDEFQTLTPATESSTRSMVSSIQDLLIPMGFARDAATEMTGDTMTLVGALTNFNSATHSAGDVASAFQSALTGEYDSLKALGIQVDAATVQEAVLAMGLASTTDEITNQMEAQALLALAYEQSGDALAAYNEDSLDTITRMGLLQSAFTDTFAEAGQSLLPTINTMLAQIQGYMPTITTLIYGFADVLGVALDVASNAFSVVMSIADFMITYWSILAPLIGGVTTALALYNGALAVQLILSKGAAAFTAVQTFLAIGWGMITGSTAAASAAMFTYNSALLACPATWIVLAIIAVIAVFYAAVAAVNYFADTSYSATGFICAAIWALAAFIANCFIAPFNAVITLFGGLWNFIATFINFLGNAWNDPIDAIIVQFYDMFTTLLSIIEAVASAIDAVLGSSLASAVQDFAQDFTAEATVAAAEQQEFVSTVSIDDHLLDTYDLGAAWDAGYSFGEGVDTTVNNMFTPDTSAADGVGDYALDAVTAYEQTQVLDDLDSIATDTGSISDSVSATSEELAYLRDLAQRDAINRYTTAEIKVDMGGVTNQVASNTDLDGMIDYLTTSLQQAMTASAEGVHA